MQQRASAVLALVTATLVVLALPASAQTSDPPSGLLPDRGTQITSADGHVFTITFVGTTCADGQTPYSMTVVKPNYINGWYGAVLNDRNCANGEIVYFDGGGTPSVSTSVAGYSQVCRRIECQVGATSMVSASLSLLPYPCFKYRVHAEDGDRQNCTIYVSVARAEYLSARAAILATFGTGNVVAMAQSLLGVSATADHWVSNPPLVPLSPLWARGIDETHSCLISNGDGYFLVSASIGVSLTGVSTGGFGGQATAAQAVIPYDIP